MLRLGMAPSARARDRDRRLSEAKWLREDRSDPLDPEGKTLFGERRARGAPFRHGNGSTFETGARAADEQRSAGGDQSPDGKNYRQRAHANLLKVSDLD